MMARSSGFGVLIKSVVVVVSCCCCAREKFDH